MSNRALLKRQWLVDAQLWLVLDQLAASPRTMAEATQQAIAGGIDAVVFRHKGYSAKEVLPLAHPTRDSCRVARVPFVLHGYPELRDELQPDGQHFSASDATVIAASGLDRSLPTGCSTHSLAEAQLRAAQGFDYVFLGPVFATPSKILFGEPLGAAEAIRVAQISDIPVVLIGGLNVDNIPLLTALQPLRIAVLSAILQAPDPAATTRLFKMALSSSRADVTSGPG